MNVSEHIESMIQHKIRSGAKVNLGSFNRQLKELGCSPSQRRLIRQRVAAGVKASLPRHDFDTGKIRTDSCGQ